MLCLRLCLPRRIAPYVPADLNHTRLINNQFSRAKYVSWKGIRHINLRENRPASVGNSEAGSQTVEDAVAGEDKRPRKSRTSAAKTSLRRAALKAQISQDEGSSSSVRQRDYSPETKTVTAYCVAEQFDLTQVSRILRDHGYKLDPYGINLFPEVIHIEAPVSMGDPSPLNSTRQVSIGDVFIFPSGTIVAWDMPEDTMIRMATSLLLPTALNPHLERIETEDLEYLEDPNKSTSDIKGDTIILGTKPRHPETNTEPSFAAEIDPQVQSSQKSQSARDVDIVLAKIAFSSGLARSTKLAVLESLLNDYFDSTRSIPTMLSRGSGLPFTRAFVLRKTGELLSIRAQLNLYSELTDSLPDIFWDSRHELGLERSYDQIGRALDVGVRIKTLNEKMDYSQEISSVLRAQLSEQHGHRLEWIIIALITIEVGFEVRRIVKEKYE